MIITNHEGLTYDDVLIIPDYSDVLTRQDIDTRSKFLGDYRLPIISAPMDTVSGPAMVAALHNVGAYGILHRFGTGQQLAENVYDVRNKGLDIEFGVSIGVKDWNSTREWLDFIAPAKIHSICIDVAHGHHGLVGETITNVREWAVEKGQTTFIIAGNVATPSGFVYLAEIGADAVRVGIGPGAACTTREKTGVGYPQLSALEEIVKIKTSYGLDNVTIIADGGIKNPGDIAKALAVGADAVMLGRLLAGADESPTDEVPRTWSGQPRQKIYRGQSMVGSNGARGAPEGIEGRVPATGPVSDTINTLNHYLRSAFSYVGANNLDEFRKRVRFVRVTPATNLESSTRL